MVLMGKALFATRFKRKILSKFRDNLKHFWIHMDNIPDDLKESLILKDPEKGRLQQSAAKSY
jgi:hypothetical protein